ncbi:hypothetical protein A2326_02105 [candidate division WWE3 bacterium RIFOXYB2_FULL_41_6]|nr:MAG: hypothetical protein A2326_02105 [candidate division WWE3 bacterium RIFOXYB2_FULL_41_6]
MPTSKRKHTFWTCPRCNIEILEEFEFCPFCGVATPTELVQVWWCPEERKEVVSEYETERGVCSICNCALVINTVPKKVLHQTQ